MSTERTRRAERPLIVVDVTSPVVARRHRQASITVSVRGSPTPRVTWYVGRSATPACSSSSSSSAAGDRCAAHDGRDRHTLVVSSASSLLDDGVWVVASNSVGQDRCFVDVKTYRGPYAPSLLASRLTRNGVSVMTSLVSRVGEPDQQHARTHSTTVWPVCMARR